MRPSGQRGRSRPHHPHAERQQVEHFEEFSADHLVLRRDRVHALEVSVDHPEEGKIYALIFGPLPTTATG